MKKITISLVSHKRLCTTPFYQVVRLTNCASFTMQPDRDLPVFQVGDTLTPAQAEIVAKDARFEVIITQAK